MKNKMRRNIIAFLVAFIMATVVSGSILNFTATKVYAAPSSWVGVAGQGSTPTGGLANNSVGYSNFKEMWDERQTTNAEWLDRTIGFIPAIMAATLHYWLAKAGVNFDEIILGRVATGHTSLYSFELADGNVYGYTGAIGYNALRAAVILFFGLVIMWELAKQGMSVSAEGKVQLKEQVYNFMIAVGALYLIPQVVDLMVYFRDQTLIHMAGALTTGTKVDIVGSYWAEYAATPGIMNAVLYCSSMVLMVYFVVMYVGIAIATTALFAFFPIVLLVGIKDKNTLTSWLRTMITQITVPCIDFFLMFIPIYLWKAVRGGTTVAANSPQAGLQFVGRIIVMFSMYLIVPMRNVVSSMIGLGGGAGAQAGLSGAQAFATSAMARARKTAAGVGVLGAAIGGYADMKRQERLDNDDSQKAQDEYSRQSEKALADGAKPREGLEVNIPPSSQNMSNQGDNASQNAQQNSQNGQTMGASATQSASTTQSADSSNGNATSGASTGGIGGGASTPSGASSTANRGGAANASPTYNQERAANLQRLENARATQANASERVTNATKEHDKAVQNLNNIQNNKASSIEKSALRKELSGIDKETARAQAEKEYDQRLSKAQQQEASTAQQLADANNDFKGADKAIKEATEVERDFAQKDGAMGGSGKSYSSKENYELAMATQAAEENRTKQHKDIENRLASLQNFTEPARLKDMAPQTRYDNAVAGRAFAASTTPITMRDANTGTEKRYGSQATYARKARQAAYVQRMSKALSNYRQASAEAGAASFGGLSGDKGTQRLLMQDARATSKAWTEQDASITNMAGRAVDRNKEMVKRGGDYIPPQVQDSEGRVVSSATGVMKALDDDSRNSGAGAFIDALNDYDNGAIAHPHGPNVPPQSEVQKQMNEKK